ncbi:hypothetical protein LINGRAHAP2_LOCUS2327 [Linum grandiflorum]
MFTTFSSTNSTFSSISLLLIPLLRLSWSFPNLMAKPRRCIEVARSVSRFISSHYGPKTGVFEWIQVHQFQLFKMMSISLLGNNEDIDSTELPLRLASIAPHSVRLTQLNRVVLNWLLLYLWNLISCNGFFLSVCFIANHGLC